MEQLPAKTQDYLKVIWDLQERSGGKVALGEVAERMGEKKPTASEAIKKLAERGFVLHQPYKGISLTDQGREIALVMIRRHRLIECFLHAKLGYSWDEVHEEAEMLEHAVSDDFIARIDAQLGHPSHDPHGDPIPNEAGEMAQMVLEDLSGLQPGDRAVVERVSDSDPELLRYLAQAGVGPGTVLQAEPAPYVGIRVFAIVDSAGIAPVEGGGDSSDRKNTIHVVDTALWAIKVRTQQPE